MLRRRKADPGSRIPDGRIAGPDSRIPDSRIADPDSRMPDPTVEYLRKLIPTLGQILGYSVEEKLIPTVEYLVRELGVPKALVASVDPKPETLNLKPDTRNSKSEIQNPKPEIRNLTPRTLEPNTRNPKIQSLKPEIQGPTRNPNPQNPQAFIKTIGGGAVPENLGVFGRQEPAAHRRVPPQGSQHPHQERRPGAVSSLLLSSLELSDARVL